MRCSVHQPAAAGWRVVLLWAQQTEGVWAAGRRQTVGVWAVEEKRDSWTFCNKFEQNNKKRLWERQRGRETWFLFSQTDLNSSICKFKCNNVDWMGRKHCHNCPDISEFHTHHLLTQLRYSVSQYGCCWSGPKKDLLISAFVGVNGEQCAHSPNLSFSSQATKETTLQVWGQSHTLWGLRTLSVPVAQRVHSWKALIQQELGG